MAKKDKAPLLTPKEEKFVAHYCVHFNGAWAVRYAAFETNWPAQYAAELLAKPPIQARVDKVIEGLGDLHFRLADEVTGQLKAMKNADRTAIFDADGNLIDPKNWPEECKLLLAGIEVEQLFEGAGEDRKQIGVTKKVKLETPKGILDSLAKLTGQWIERSQFLDKHGRPIDPPAAAQPVINVTVGATAPQKQGNGHA
jgi:phage terminase small subunit